MIEKNMNNFKVLLIKIKGILDNSDFMFVTNTIGS